MFPLDAHIWDWCIVCAHDVPEMVLGPTYVPVSDAVHLHPEGQFHHIVAGICPSVRLSVCLSGTNAGHYCNFSLPLAVGPTYVPVSDAVHLHPEGQFHHILAGICPSVRPSVCLSGTNAGLIAISLFLLLWVP